MKEIQICCEMLKHEARTAKVKDLDKQIGKVWRTIDQTYFFQASALNLRLPKAHDAVGQAEIYLAERKLVDAGSGEANDDLGHVVTQRRPETTPAAQESLQAHSPLT